MCDWAVILQLSSFLKFFLTFSASTASFSALLWIVLLLRTNNLLVLYGFISDR